jgi:transposase InsO family protein
MGVTIVSISRITKAGYTVSFEGDSCKIKNRRGVVIGTIPATSNGLYKVDRAYVAAAAAMLERADMLTLHRRLGHIAPDTIRALIKSGAVEGIQLIDDGSALICDSCEHAKTTRKPVRKERDGPLADAFGAEVHSDLWGPSPVPSLGGRKYYVTFTDDHTRYTKISILRSKDQTLDAYKGFAAWAQTQHGVRIKRLRSDRGGEYTGTEFSNFLQAQGTERRLTTHDTPQHNGVAESLNRRLVERVRALLHHSGLPKTLWAEALHFAVWLKNRTSTRALGIVTPFERLTKSKPNLAGVPIWGQRVWVHNDSGSKLDARATVARWVGYDADSTHAHRIYWPEKNSVSVERNVKFTSDRITIRIPPLSKGNAPAPAAIATPPTPPAPPASPPAPAPGPSVPPQRPPATSSGEEELEEEEEDTPPPVTPQPPPAPKKVRIVKILPPTQPARQSTRTRKPSEYARRLASGEGSADGGPALPGSFEAEEGESYTHIDTHLDTGANECAYHAGLEEAMAAAVQNAEGDPKSLAEARSRSDWPSWKDAMDREIETLEKAGTWKNVPRPPGKNVVGCKWVFRIKRKADGTVEKYKARLVARGFTQIHGVDYFDTYSPVAKLASFRLILALAARFGWEVHAFDFNAAYLNGELGEGEEIYMQQPPGYEVGSEEWVKELLKAIYGLKQAGRKWYDVLYRALIELGFRVSAADPCVFFIHIGEHVLIIAIHVDDCAMTGSSVKLILEYKEKLNARYPLTDLGPVSWLLGIKITRDLNAGTISLSQKSYIDSIIARFVLNDAKPYDMPMTPSASYSKDDSPSSQQDAARMRKVPYREAIGSLMYASVATRPDITFAVSTLSQFLENPGEAHWEAVKRVFRYLSGTRDYALTYGGERHDLTGYTDADGASQDHRRAISGYAFLFDGGAISWSSRKQELVTLSTAEAEYVAATHAAKECIWLRRLIGELCPTILSTTTLHCDNQAALKLATDDNYHARTKHIDIRYHFIRQVVASGAIDITYCPTDDMTADILTKALPRWKVACHVLGLGLRRASGGVV